MADPGGGRGSGPPPLLGHDVGFLTLGPKLDPPFLLVDLRWTPVADPGCVGVTGVITPPPLGMWMTSHGQCPRGGGVLVNVQEWGCFSIFLRADDVTRTMPKGGGVLVVKNPVSAPGPPPPISKILGRVALTVGVVLGPVLNLSKSFQINCVKR